jgi:hypothetical protein
VPDAQGLYPTLLAERERDKETELDQLGNGEVLVESGPKGAVRYL